MGEIKSYRSTTMVSKTRSSLPVFWRLWAEPFLQMWQVPAFKISVYPSQTAVPVPDKT